MTPAVEILLLWIGFAATHVGLSSVRVRAALVARIGERAYQGLYSLVAFAFFVPLVWIYFDNRHAGAWLWGLPRGPVLTWVVNLGMGLSFVLIAAGILRPSPASINPGPTEPRGVQRITRHPLVMGIGLFGLLHLLPNSSAADVAFFAGFAAFALVGAAHQDARKLASGDPGFRSFCEATPFFPFTGRETLRGLRELSPLALAIGVAATIGVRYLH